MLACAVKLASVGHSISAGFLEPLRDAAQSRLGSPGDDDRRPELVNPKP